MQLRDAKPDIFYPDYWGCFGGAVHHGENHRHALLRELRKELEFAPTRALRFTRFDFDIRPLGQKAAYRIYYLLPVSRSAFSQFVLHEGVQFCVFSAAELLPQPRLVPYDDFSIWMQCRQEQFQA
jgi:ADP-ribose pyrophosphatase YjhB (NUDIX family)